MFSRYAVARSLATAAAKRASSSTTTSTVSHFVHPLSTVSSNPAAIVSTIASMQRLHSSTTTTLDDSNKESAQLLLQKKLELVLEIESQLLDLAEHTQEKQDVVYNNIGMTTAGDLDALFKDSHLKRDTISEKVSELKQLIEEAKTLYTGSVESSSTE
mmetsp:Transcript_56173/g.136096  ORF Transcript_56173/g.136096 Transcript_56173/m.136096 type:complete len:158 (-) Transcript_56173:129-602(-)|eukprot:CAMPEP_0113468892 /NCGR_PEP_ID=MMETSP0014_2-20120614/15603_1 /TAXON_ID=2857 /ORGANISM="Nitzschia sp." /LENGTH=157 /DNA_ID=CAMNT_0000361323 /DNA_START=426 /DNA_END=899 /DNA_ORIENTATION=+ /assembly_acc=CAM_ASM_000159